MLFPTGSKIYAAKYLGLYLALTPGAPLSFPPASSAALWKASTVALSVPHRVNITSMQKVGKGKNKPLATKA